MIRCVLATGALLALACGPYPSYVSCGDPYDTQQEAFAFLGVQQPPSIREAQWEVDSRSQDPTLAMGFLLDSPEQAQEWVRAELGCEPLAELTHSASPTVRGVDWWVPAAPEGSTGCSFGDPQALGGSVRVDPLPSGEARVQIRAMWR